MDHSSTLVFSTRLPVLVCGTGILILSLEVFLGNLIRVVIHSSEDLWYYQVQHNLRIYLQIIYLHSLTQYSVTAQTFHSFVTPSQIKIVLEY